MSAAQEPTKPTTSPSTEPSPDPSARRSPWRSRLVTVLLLAGVLLGVHLFQTAGVPAGPGPAFSGVLADGTPVSLEAWRRQHPGRPVALHFWAEWCAVCKASEHNVNALLGDWPVLTVAMQSGDAAAVARHLRERGLEWPTVVDTSGAITRQYGLRGVPALVVLDGAGRISAVSVGYTSELGMRLRLWWARLSSA